MCIDSQPGVFSLILFSPQLRFIGGTVIHQDHFSPIWQIGEKLIELLQKREDIIFLVKSRDDDA